MRRLLFLALLFFTPLAHAWNGAGHRLVALIAWEQLSPASRAWIDHALRRHPDYVRWQAPAEEGGARAVFIECSTWPDQIRRDPRFFTEEREPPTPTLPGFPDMARHKRWHYVDRTPRGQAPIGEADRQINRLAHVLERSDNPIDTTYALPWLIHLVADLHQPLHAGDPADEGGNKFEIENPLDARQPISNLHAYWDGLAGPSTLRGKRLETQARRLLDTHPAPHQGDVSQWREESHALLAQAYPTEAGSLLPLVTEAFDAQARRLAAQRIVDAGYRLGRLLESRLSRRVSRETPARSHP